MPAAAASPAAFSPCTCSSALTSVARLVSLLPATEVLSTISSLSSAAPEGPAHTPVFTVATPATQATARSPTVSSDVRESRRFEAVSVASGRLRTASGRSRGGLVACWCEWAAPASTSRSNGLAAP